MVGYGLLLSSLKLINDKLRNRKQGSKIESCIVTGKFCLAFRGNQVHVKPESRFLGCCERKWYCSYHYCISGLTELLWTNLCHPINFQEQDIRNTFGNQQSKFELSKEQISWLACLIFENKLDKPENSQIYAKN